jgi:hypothetical protein
LIGSYSPSSDRLFGPSIEQAPQYPAETASTATNALLYHTLSGSQQTSSTSILYDYTVMRSDEHLYSGASAFAKGVQRCLALTPPWRPFPQSWARTPTRMHVPGSCRWSWRQYGDIARTFQARVSGFGNGHVPRTLLAMLLMHIEDYKSFMNHA